MNSLPQSIDYMMWKKKKPSIQSGVKELWLASDFYIAFFTNPERIQRVQTLTLFTDPVFSSTQRNFCKLGYHVADVLLLAWLTLLPMDGFLPHTSQTRDI